MLSYEEGSYAYINGAGLCPNTMVFKGAGTLVRIIINTSATATLTLQDSPGIGTIAVLTNIPAGSYNYGIFVKAGLAINLTGSPDLTIVYRR